MAGTPFKTGPIAFAAAAGNLYNNGSALIFTLIRHMHIANTAAASSTYTLYLGATGGSAAGTELAKLKPVAASETSDIYFPAGLKLLSTDFISGLASATTNTITFSGELYVV